MAVTYSDPVKNADINKSKAALVEIIDELRTRFARKNDAWSEAEALAASRLELLRRVAVWLKKDTPNHPLLKEINKELGDV